MEWPIEQTRANEAAARLFWPLGDSRLARRLKLIEAPTLLLWGEQDRVMPRSYAEKFAREEAGLVPTRPCSNLHDNILVVIWILRRQKDLKPVLDPLQLALKQLMLLLGHLDQLQDTMCPALL